MFFTGLLYLFFEDDILKRSKTQPADAVRNYGSRIIMGMQVCDTDFLTLYIEMLIRTAWNGLACVDCYSIQRHIAPRETRASIWQSSGRLGCFGCISTASIFPPIISQWALYPPFDGALSHILANVYHPHDLI